MNYGIKVSKPGKNVKTCEDKDLVFSSDWNTYKIFLKGTFSLTANDSSSAIKTISHNLGYPPVAIVIGELQPNKWYLDSFWTDNWHFAHFVSADNNNVYVELRNDSTSLATKNFKYAILIEDKQLY